MQITTTFGIPILHARTVGAEDVWQIIKPKVETFWADPNAILPDWIIAGGVQCTTNPENYTEGAGFINRWPEMKTIMDQINPLIQEYYKLLNLDPAYEPYVNEMWVNNVPAGCVGEMHNHPEPLAGSYYFDVEPDAGFIEIENPKEASMVEKYTVNIGDVFLWPGWLRHRVVANPTGRNRISCGFTCLTKRVEGASTAL